MLCDLHKSFPLNFSYHCMDPSLLLDCSLLLSLFLLCPSLPSSLSFFGTPPWVTAQYPALLGLSSLSRWLTWITVHTPRSGPMIKTVTEGICYLSLAFVFLLLSINAVIPPLPLSPSLPISTWTYIHTSPCGRPPPFGSLFHPPLLNPLFVPPSLCIESGAAWLSLPPHWAGACLKSPRTPHTPRVSSHARDALSPLISIFILLTSSHAYQFIRSLFRQKNGSNHIFSSSLGLFFIKIRNISLGNYFSIL